MTAAITARVAIPAVAAQNGPSVGSNTPYTANYTGAADPTTMSFVWGVSATRPTVFTDLTHPTTFHPLDADRFTFRYNTGTSAYDGDIAGGLGARTTDSVGQHMWCCLFNVNTPSGSDPVAAAAGPFVLIA